MRKTYGTMLNLMLGLKSGKSVRFPLVIRNARYKNQLITDDVALQEELEAHGAFGKSFLLLHTEGVQDSGFEVQDSKPVDNLPPAPASEEELLEATGNGEVQGSESVDNAPADSVDEEGFLPAEKEVKQPSGKITTIKGAINWLKENLGIEDEQISNIEDVKAIAKSHNISFSGIPELS